MTVRRQQHHLALTKSVKVMVRGIFWSLAAFLSWGVAKPTLAANQIRIYVSSTPVPVPVTVTSAGLESFALTGDTSSLPLEFALLPLQKQQKLQRQLNRPISISPNSPELIDTEEEKELLEFLAPGGTDEEKRYILTLMAQRGNGQSVISFLKALPVDTLTQENLIPTLLAYNATSAITLSIGGTQVPGQGQISSVPGVTTIDFESGVPTFGPVVYSAPGFSPAVVSGSVSNKYFAPTGDITKYLTVAPLSGAEGTNPVTISFAQPINYFGLYWGSVNEHNSIAFYNGNTLLEAFTGSSFMRPYQSSFYTNFFAEAGQAIDRVVLTSTSPAFESDNHAYRVAEVLEPASEVPEPASVVGVLVAGVLGVGVRLKRKRQ